MKLIIDHVHAPSTHEVDHTLRTGIAAFKPRLEIEAAHARLECEWQASPKFRVSVHLVTPGPDILAESRDHTLAAAVRKVLAELEFKVLARERKIAARARSRLNEPRRGPGAVSRS